MRLQISGLSIFRDQCLKITLEKIFPANSIRNLTMSFRFSLVGSNSINFRFQTSF